MTQQQSLDEVLMRRCIELAEQAALAGEAPVGSLLASAGRIITHAIESARKLHDPSAHAEALVVRHACQLRRSVNLSDCTLYTTVEPCVLCSYLIRKSAIARVVYGIPTEHAGGVTSKYAILIDPSFANRSAPPLVTAGVLADQCREVLRKRPH